MAGKQLDDAGLADRVLAIWAMMSPSRSSAPRTLASTRVELLAVGTVGGKETHRRHAKAFLPGIPRVGHIAARNGTTDIGPVCQVDGEGFERAVHEHRTDGLDVGQVVASDLRQIDKPDVAGDQALAGNPFEELLDRAAHDAQVHGHVASLGDEFARSIGERGGKVAGLPQQR